MSEMTADPSQLLRDQRGAIYLETLIAFMPVLVAFLAILQFTDVAASQLLVRRAAGAAVRAAVVVLPDDGRFYGDPDNAMVHRFEGLRRADIERAAGMVLSLSSRLRPATQDGAPIAVDVQLSGEFSERNPITAQVTAHHHCMGGLIGYACGLDRAIELTARASLPYQGADYDY
jgi:Flp pilus assembly protein TadG